MFCNEWTRLRTSPIEQRTLWHPTSASPQGEIGMWLGIFSFLFFSFLLVGVVFYLFILILIVIIYLNCSRSSRATSSLYG